MYQIPEENLGELVEKLEKLQSRAVKLGKGYGGRCTVRAAGWRVTQFDFTYNGHKWKFAKIS